MEQLSNSAEIKLSIIIPVYNEARFISTVIEKVKSVKLPDNIMEEIIVIDDGSTDATGKILEQYNSDSAIKIFHQEKNMGKSSAVRLGIEMSTGDIILIQDADLEYNPDDYPKLIEPIIAHKSTVVYGSRFKGTIKRMHIINKIANIVSNITLNLLYNTEISDVNTGYKVFRRDVLNDIKLISKNFTFEAEITAKLLNRGYSIYEVPIGYTARSKKEGKKMGWIEALQMYCGIIKYKFETDDRMKWQKLF
jgi:glycosyltransferase involved in cell wall biosynthesis